MATEAVQLFGRNELGHAPADVGVLIGREFAVVLRDSGAHNAQRPPGHVGDPRSVGREPRVEDSGLDRRLADRTSRRVAHKEAATERERDQLRGRVRGERGDAS